MSGDLGQICRTKTLVPACGTCVGILLFTLPLTPGLRVHSSVTRPLSLTSLDPTTTLETMSYLSLPTQHGRPPRVVHTVELYRQMIPASAVRVLMHLQNLDNLPLDLRAGISPVGLGEKCNMDAGPLEGLLRLRTSNGVVYTSSSGQFSHSASALDLHNGCTSARLLWTEWDGAVSKSPIFIDWPGKYGVRREPQGLTSIIDNAFTYTDGSPGVSVCTITSKNATRSRNVHKGLDTLNSVFPSIGSYDLEAIIERSLSSESAIRENYSGRMTLVDVGGGSGDFLVQLLEEYPNLSPSHVALQDLPHVIELARRNPKLPERVRLQAHDFFSEQPIRHARAYHIRLCLHNYSDEGCTRILKHLADAMAPQSKLLLSENVLPNVAANVLVNVLDTTMLPCEGNLRSLVQLRTLLARVGLKLNKVHNVYNSTWCMLESSPM